MRDKFGNASTKKIMTLTEGVADHSDFIQAALL